MKEDQAPPPRRWGWTSKFLVLLTVCLLSLASAGAHSLPAKSDRYIESLLEQAQAKEAHADFAGALRLSGQALAQAERVRDERLIVASLTRLGRAHLLLGQLAQAATALQRARHLAERRKDQPLLSSVHQMLGDLEMAQGQYASALTHFQQAHRLAESAGDHGQVAVALTKIANVHLLQGDATQAMAAYQQALPLARTPQDQITVLYNLGIAYLNQADSNRALDHLERAYRLAEQLGDRPALNKIQNGLAQVYLFQGSGEQALDMYQKVVRSATAAGQTNVLVSALISTGFLHLQQGDLAQAEAAFKQSLSLIKRHPAPMPEAVAWLGLGSVHLQKQQLDAAWQEVGRGLQLGQALGVSRITAVAHSKLGQISQARGQWSLALHHYRETIRCLESLRRGIPLSEQRAAFFGLVLSPYEDLIAALLQQHHRQPDQGYLAEAIAYVERARARALLDHLAEAQINLSEQLDPDLRQREKTIERQISQIQNHLQLPTLSPSQRTALVQALQQSEQAYEQLLLEIRRRNPQYATFRYPEPITSQQIQQLLPPEAALVEYFLGKKHAWVFVITRDRLRVYPLAVDQRWSESVETYLRLLADEKRADSQLLKPIARRFYEVLMAPALSELPPQIDRLIISPDGLLNYLPFETLVCPCSKRIAGRQSPAGEQAPISNRQPPTSDCYLVEQHTLSYTPSAAVLERLRRAPPTPDHRNDLLVFADPQLAPGLATGNEAVKEPTTVMLRLYDEEGFSFAPLAFARQEAEAITTYARRGCQLLLGGAATEDQVKRLPLERFRIVHFATHSFVVEQAPARSAIVLCLNGSTTEDGFLQAREVYHLKLDADLVVLSACQTGRGPFIAGDGVQGLPRAFFAAGTRAVLMSLWDVNDQWTAKLMAAFYRHLGSGLGPAAALRQAKLELLRSGPGSDPRLWAALVLTGQTDQPIKISGPSWFHRHRRLVTILTLMVMLAVVGGYSLRRRLPKSLSPNP